MVDCVGIGIVSIASSSSIRSSIRSTATRSGGCGTRNVGVGGRGLGNWRS